MAVTPFLALLKPLTERHRPVAPAPDMPTSGGVDEAQAREALAEAQETLTEARRDAETLREDARVQAEALREAAWQEGFHAGKEAGQTAVELAVRKEHAAQLASWRAEVEQLTEAIAAARQELWAGQEAEMVTFVLDIARQVVKTEVTQNPQVVTEVLQNALRRVTDKDHVRIRVSLADAAQVRGMREDLLNLMDGVKNLEIVDDRRIGPGGCVVETNAGTIDAKIETQMAEVERALTHALEG